jgi:hypothetical protein
VGQAFQPDDFVILVPERLESPPHIPLQRLKLSIHSNNKGFQRTHPAAVVPNFDSDSDILHTRTSTHWGLGTHSIDSRNWFEEQALNSTEMDNAALALTILWGLALTRTLETRMP